MNCPSCLFSFAQSVLTYFLKQLGVLVEANGLTVEARQGLVHTLGRVHIGVESVIQASPESVCY